MSYPITSCNVFKQTWDFLEWISITSIPTLLNSDAMYPSNDNDDDDNNNSNDDDSYGDDGDDDNGDSNGDGDDDGSIV